jgi:hypothetical protein
MKVALVALLLTAPFRLSDGKSDNAELVRWLVAHQDDLKDVPFGDVVMAATGKRILPVDPRRDAAILQKLGVALDATLLALNEPSHSIHLTGRVNEASRFIEDEIRKQVNLLPGWKCTIPRTTVGREQRAGYPDLRIVTDTGTVIYFDPKLYATGSRSSSLRTFYYEPRSLTGKIQDDALHLLAGIEHDGNKASAIRLTRWDLIDVSKLRVSLKAEFQAGNDRIYRSETIVGRSVK